MTDEEKAKEIYKDNLYDCEVRGVVQDEQEILFMLEKMAKWKEQQMIWKAAEWLREYTDDYFVRDTDECWLREDDFIRDFQNYMKE